ncbi:MAG: HAMP domain-containing protein [Brevefilum sp.]|nr:HAMP domain-containing protein [Brevefilum sp.]
MSRWLFSRRFVVQLILIFVIFTLVTVIGLGIPITIFLTRQVESQMQALLDQANQTTLVLYENKNAQLDILAELIIERPTLNRLVLEEEDDPQALDVYLDEFLDNTLADIIVVCDASRSIATVGEGAVSELCAHSRWNAFTSIGDEVWLLTGTLLSSEGAPGLQVVVGQRAGSILAEFSRQSGLDYLLFDGRQLSVSTEIDGASPQLLNITPDIVPYQKLALNVENPQVNTHMGGVIPISNEDGFTLIGLLDIGVYYALLRDLRYIILATLLVVSLVGVLVAILVSRRISQPLNKLARSAVALREGDLTTSLASGSKVWEIDQLTNALEDARVSLKHSLDQLRLEKAWIENLLNSVVEGLLAVDDKMRINFASEAVERITGARLSMFLGRSLDDVFITPGGEDLFSHQIPAPNQSRRIPVTINGREVLLAVSASKILPPDAGNATLALVIRDVSDEERIHRLLGEFLANITHEFRTPLTALSASVELLLDQLPSLSTPEIDQLLHAINIGIIDLQSLIDNLIEAASIEAGRFKVNPKPTPLEAIILDAIGTVEPLAQKQDLKLVFIDPNQAMTLLADQRRTSQALLNLLSNSIKHSPAGGTITVQCRMMDNAVQVDVIDEGQGIPKNQHSKLFNRFMAPISEDDGDQLGLGLGLSVVKAIIEAQNGSVGYRDAEKGGAVFWFTLPVWEGDD